jgi:hypothetical protein
MGVDQNTPDLDKPECLVLAPGCAAAGLVLKEWPEAGSVVPDWPGQGKVVQD